MIATVAYNPMSANLRELSKRMEAELFGSAPGGGIQDASGFWLNQKTSDGETIINAARSEQQGIRLTGLTLFRFDTEQHFKERVEAREATLEAGRWLFKGVRRFSLDSPPVDQASLEIPTTLTEAQVRNSFSTPETVSFWQLPSYIRSSESSGFATAGYRLQYQKLLATAVFACSHGDARGLRVVALLPDGRRAEDGFEWRGRRLSALRSVESD
ncbi:lipopolysaccharide export LptBFGC system permease protein LptF [Bradyrhizobium sp. GM5.1]